MAFSPTCFPRPYNTIRRFSSLRPAPTPKPSIQGSGVRSFSRSLRCWRSLRCRRRSADAIASAAGHPWAPLGARRAPAAQQDARCAAAGVQRGNGRLAAVAQGHERNRTATQRWRAVEMGGGVSALTRKRKQAVPHPLDGEPHPVARQTGSEPQAVH